MPCPLRPAVMSADCRVLTLLYVQIMKFRARVLSIFGLNCRLVCRELGCEVKESKFLGKHDNRTYTVSLLPEQPVGQPTKQLKDYFPALRVNKAR